MFRWFYVWLDLLHEAGAARRDARIRFLKAQVEILRRKLGGNRVIPSPAERARLLAIGAELKHAVADIVGIVTPQTYSRWVAEHGPSPSRRFAFTRGSPLFATTLELEGVGWCDDVLFSAPETRRRHAASQRVQQGDVDPTTLHLPVQCPAPLWNKKTQQS